MLTWNDLTGKTNDHITPYLTDSVFKNSPVFTRLKSKRRFEFPGGLTIRHNIMYAPLKGGAFQRGQAFDTSYVQSDTALQFNIKYYYVNVTIYGTDQVLNRGSEAAMSFIGSKMINASGTMAQLLATDLYGDGGANGTTSLNSTLSLDGAAEAVNVPANYATYGGITRTDIASAQNTGINAYYAAPAAFSLGAVQTAFGAAWFGQEKPDMLVTTQPVWDAFWNKLQPQQRFNDETSDVHVGFRSFFWNGAQVVVDQYLGALSTTQQYTIFGFNTNYIYLYVSSVPKYQFGFTGWKEAQNTDDVAGQYLFGGNLVFAAPRLMFNLGFTAL
jgi:hypothetical protein